VSTPSVVITRKLKWIPIHNLVFCMQALTLALQFSSANLLQILHASFESGTAVAAPICYKFCMQALSLALQSQRQIVTNSACKL
jgi:7-cyano-7-deazaguanine synthase in queuosine biosynthesis